MRMFKVSLKGEKPKTIDFRGSMVILKEGEEYSAESPIYKFFSKYFVPSTYYTPPVKEVVEKMNPLDEFSEEINTSENDDVIIETTHQD